MKKNILKKIKIKPTTIIITLLIIIIIFLLFGANPDKINDFLLKNFKINNNNLNTNISIYNNDVDLNNKFIEASVVRIVDGDTIVVNMLNKEYKVRLIGVNTPEYTSKKEYYGKEATEYTTKELTGKTIYLEKDISQTDKYDRLLRYVWLEKPTKITYDEMKNKMLNAMLLINGYATPMTIPPDVSYESFFKNFVKEAKYKKVGIWSKK